MHRLSFVSIYIYIANVLLKPDQLVCGKYVSEGRNNVVLIFCSYDLLLLIFIQGPYQTSLSLQTSRKGSVNSASLHIAMCFLKNINGEHLPVCLVQPRHILSNSLPVVPTLLASICIGKWSWSTWTGFLSDETMLEDILQHWG